MDAQKTILVVDDNAAMRHLIPFAIAETGCKIVIARNGAEALLIAAAETVHLLITDLFMGDMDGYALVEALRRSTANANLPAIVFTGYTHPDLDSMPPDTKIIQMTKPFSFSEMKRSIGLLLTPPGEA